MLWPDGTSTRPRVSSPFGPRPNVGAFSFHYGTDLVGYSIVRAAGAGKVTFAGWMNSAAGNTVVIDLGGGVTELHMHLASFAVSRGDRVNPAHALGRMGSTGNASGNCDHFEIRVNGTSVDPMAYTAARINGTPSGSGGNQVPEEDDMSERAEQQIEAVYAGFFGPANVINPATGRPASEVTTWAKPFGEKGGSAYYGIFDVILGMQAQIRSLVERPASAVTADQVRSIADAVVKAVGKPTVTLDYAAIAKAVNDDAARRMAG